MSENTSSPSQKGRIFISYRRIDSAGYAGRIYDRLVAYFGEDAIFMDVDTIEGGTDFIKVLEDAVQSCDVLIALIGKQWLTIKDKDGKPRLDNPEDFVRIEIATALKRNIRVIPVLVDGVDMPQPTELPENIKALARRNALQVNHHSFNPDIYRLIEHTKSALDEAEKSRVMKAQALQVEREKVARDAIEKAHLEAEELARQKAIKEKAAREAAEKAKRENAKRQAARRAELKLALAKAIPYFRIVGVIGIVVIFIWGGSLVIPKFITLIPTPKPTTTFTLTPKPITPSRTPETIQPSKTPTKIVTPTKKITPTPTLRVGSTMIGEDGATLLYVPAGDFEMGGSVSDAMAECWKVGDECSLDWFTDEEPIHTVYLDPYWIDQTEVTNEMFSKFVAETGYETDAEKEAGAYKFVNDMWHQTEGVSWLQPSGKGSNISNIMDHPVVNVTWGDAKAYCEWAGKRLPTEAEWEKAAGWNDKLKVKNIYPWGDVFECKKGNFDDETQVDSYVVKGGAGCDGFSQTAPVGSFPEGASYYDVLDMAGNVWEWVEDWYNPEYYNSSSALSNPLGPSFGSEHVSRGGSWMFQYAFYFRTADRGWYIPIDAIPNAGNGFRCAMDAP